MTKTCSKCKRVLDVECFYKNKGTLDGYGSWCKECTHSSYDSEARRRKYEANKDKELKQSKEYYEANKERVLKRCNDYNHCHVEQRKKQNKEYRLKNKDRIKAYYEENKERIFQKRKQRMTLDPVYRMSCAFSSAISRALQQNKSELHWETLIYYNLAQLREHLEKQFTSEMNWDNYGTYWEIDHIIPQNLFNYTSYNDKDFIICWSLYNLRPLSAYDNRCRPKDGNDIDIKTKYNEIYIKLKEGGYL